ncbi:MAG: hypothetical protein ACI4JB_04995, partial [Porcipelethomonas sp.]
MEDIAMLENALLSYVNIKNHIFDNADFNFDNEYEFHLHIDKSTYPHYKYRLFVETKDTVPIPNGFWGKNITSLNVILGKNGAGKTSFFRFMVNNLISSTAMNGEGMIYIIRCNDTLLYFSNIRDDCLSFDNTTTLGINLVDGKNYISEIRRKNEIWGLYDNNFIWKSVIMYSNSIDLEYIEPNNDICVDASINSRINSAVRNIIKTSFSSSALEKEIMKQNNFKILEHYGASYFTTFAQRLNVTLPHAIRFKIEEQKNYQYKQILEDNYAKRFSN